MKKAVVAALASACMAAPLYAFAAGFAPQSIFLSKSPVTQGDTVRIYTIVTNPTSDKFAGTVALTEGSDEIGSVAVTLAAGATQTTSVFWKPLAGTHAITATLKSNAGAVVESKQETFIVNAPPKPATPVALIPSQPAAVESSQQIQQSINNVSPQVGGAVAPAFNYIDSLRNGTADALDKQIASIKPKLGPSPLQGQVEGASTQAPSPTDWAWSMFYTIYFYLLTLLRFIVGSAAVFYPVLAFAFLYFMWKMFRKFRRPAY